MIAVDKILQTDFLDLLFDKKNKIYGAYELRKQYNRRLLIALLIVVSSILLTALSVYLGGVISSSLKKKKEIEIREVVLEDLKKEEPKAPPPPPPPKPPEPKVEMKKFTPPKIVPDEQVKEDEKPPEVKELADTKISTVNQEGLKTEVVEAPVSTPEAAPSPVVEEVLTKVEKEAEFPGGGKGWQRFVEREINKYIDDLTDAGFSGTVVIQFIVDREGNVSDVVALSNGHTKLAEIAIKAIKQGPKWTPGVQNGKYVKAYRKQPVTFRIEE